jgi:ATP-dependent DNA helicase RecG
VSVKGKDPHAELELRGRGGELRQRLQARRVRLVQVMRNLGIDSRRATLELADLVDRGLAVRIGERRHARYLLGPVPSPTTAGAATPKQSEVHGRDAQLLSLFQPGETLTRQEVESRSGLSTAMVNRTLARLIQAGAITATAPPRSRHRRYHRTR